MGRKKTKYQIYKNSLDTGKFMYCDEITKEFGLDQRNISKYSEIGGRVYRETWNFVPYYDEEKASTFLMADWDKITKTAKSKILPEYYVLAKRVGELGDYSVAPKVFKTNASSADIAIRIIANEIGPEYKILDATSKKENISYLIRKNNKGMKVNE